MKNENSEMKKIDEFQTRKGNLVETWKVREGEYLSKISNDKKFYFGEIKGSKKLSILSVAGKLNS